MSQILQALSLSMTPVILPAPMAGGPTTPQLVREAADAGSIGTLAWGTKAMTQGGTTIVSRGFSGRYARGVETPYARDHRDAPTTFPYLDPVLAARRATGDAAVSYCLAGSNVAAISRGSVTEIFTRLRV